PSPARLEDRQARIHVRRAGLRRGAPPAQTHLERRRRGSRRRDAGRALRRRHLKNALAFLRGSDPPDYGRFLSRLRWRRGIPADAVLDLSGDVPAREAFAGAEVWLVVMDE